MLLPACSRVLDRQRDVDRGAADRRLNQQSCKQALGSHKQSYTVSACFWVCQEGEVIFCKWVIFTAERYSAHQEARRIPKGCAYAQPLQWRLEQGFCCCRSVRARLHRG
jgi:hypothetical protein